MTNDFKEQLLNYLTGTIEQQTGTNEPQFEELKVITNNLETYIWDNYGLSSRPYIIDIIKSNQNDNYLVYGRGSTTNNTFYGFIIILDNNFQIIDSTNQYSSGTTMNQFLKLNQATNGTFYGIDTDGTNYRFIMLNNILLKATNQENYKYILKKTYNITSNYPSNFQLKDIIKNPNSSNYLIYGTRLTNSHYRPIAIEYKINVGSTNDWTQYEYNSSDNFSYGINGAWASWDTEGNLTFRLIGGNSNNFNQIHIYQNSGSSITILNTYNMNIDTSGFDYFDGIIFSSVILNNNNAYVLAFVYGNSNQAIIFRITNNSMIKLYESPIYDGMLGNLLTLSLKTDYINTYFWYLMPITQDVEWTYYGGLIIENNVYQTTIYQGGDISQNALLNGYNQFNLYSITLQAGNNLYKVPFIFNQFNYNGLKYEDINSLVPRYSNLYDENGNIIFSRNLYNLSINGGTTTSTIEVPNTFLNDTTIAQQNLLSKTNMIMNNNVDNITKNIYETLDINFINTITMQDNDNSINLNGATRLNASATSTNDYIQSQIGYYRLNYTDGTSEDFKINPSEYTPTDEYSGTYNFVVYVKKAINNINILSNDKTTVYATLNLVLEVGKNYEINQNVEVI